MRQQIQKIAINQGGFVDPKTGNACCGATAPQCKIQTGYGMGLQISDEANNQTAFLNQDNTGIVNDYTLGKQMAIDATGACQAWCPLDGTFMDDAGFFPDNETINDMGKSTSYCAGSEHYQWTDMVPIFNITMQSTDFYVNNDAGVYKPCMQIVNIEPMGQQIGVENTTFTTFDTKITTPIPKVTGVAACKQSKNCNGGGGGGGDDDQQIMAASSDEWEIVRHLGVGWLKIQRKQ